MIIREECRDFNEASSAFKARSRALHQLQMRLKADTGYIIQVKQHTNPVLDYQLYETRVSIEFKEEYNEH